MDDNYIPVITRFYSIKLYLRDILYIERQSRVLFFHTEKEDLKVYEGIQEVLPYLDSRFYPCLTGLLINFDKVDRMRDGRIFFCDKKTHIDCGRQCFTRTKGAFNKYMLTKAGRPGKDHPEELRRAE